MTDKNPEVLASGASIMKNVWEIRLREYGQKMKSEQERQENSALQRINEDWAKRMSGKVKPRRVERKVKPPEESPAQTYKAKQMALGRPSGFVSSRPQKPADVKKDVAKRNKLTLLLSLNEKQPGLMIWTKSWKFSQPLPQSGEMPPASDWGQQWKCLNIQPNIEGKSWTEHEHDDTNNDITYNGVLFSLEKIDKPLYSGNFEEDLATIEWEKSWKYTKQSRDTHGGGKNGPKNSRQEKLDILYQSHCYNEERCSSNWNDSWKSGKPPREESITFTHKSVSQKENNMETEEQSTMSWGQSWKHFKKELHMKSTRPSTPPDWVDSWRVSKPVPQISQQLKNVSEPQMSMPEEPLDPKSYQTIMDASKEEKYNLLWSSQFQGKDVPLPATEWQKSWMTVKNFSECKEQPMEKTENPKLGTIQQVLPRKHVEFEVFSYPRKHKPAEVLELSKHMDKDTFISRWKDSWKSLKNQRRQERIRSRLQRMSPPTQAATPQTSLTEWANSWRFTNLNANQDSNLWQQGWATYTRNQPDRRVREEALNEGAPRNGPTGARGWGESWRSTRHRHRVEREATRTILPSTQLEDTQIHRRERSLADWEQSWQFSTDHSHHDRPSTTEWADSWRFCSFHCENWVEGQPEPNWHEKTLEIKARKELPCPSHRFSRSFEPQTFKERFPPQEWKDSWKLKRFDGKEQPRSGLSHLMKKEFPQPWDDSWMVSTTQLYRSEHTASSSIHGHSVSDATQYDSTSEWGRLWKISNPQPPANIALWSEANPNPYNPQQMVFWSRYKSNNYLFSPLDKDCASLRKWGHAWRFMKLESKLDMKSMISQSKQVDDSVIMSKRVKAKKHMYSQIYKEAPQAKRWTDACKLAKTQPRPKRDVRCIAGQGIDESDKAMFAKWAESWRFVTDSVSDEPVKTLVCLTDWEDSWKFLLKAYPPQNGPKKIKGRS